MSTGEWGGSVAELECNGLFNGDDCVESETLLTVEGSVVSSEGSGDLVAVLSSCQIFWKLDPSRWAPDIVPRMCFVPNWVEIVMKG